MSGSWRIGVLPGDGIGPEVTAEAIKALHAVAACGGYDFAFIHAPCGGAALELAGEPLPDVTVELCLKCDAVLFGAVGGPSWDGLPRELRPEQAILGLRQRLGLYANLRPVRTRPSLAGVGPLKERHAGPDVDFIIVRELTGGLYYGPKRREALPGGGWRSTDTMVYSSEEVARIARLALRLASSRRGRLTSVDKANVLECSRLWREVVSAEAGHNCVALEHLYVDDCAARLVLDPARFDVIVTENTFGDILSDLGAVLAGSLGLLPSASLGDEGPALYEPVHGSAPDIAGRGLANPVGAILSAAMLLRHSLGLEAAASVVESAVDRVLAAGHRTADISGGGPSRSTQAVGDAVAAAIADIWAEGRQLR